jgi:hyperosmotically inducible periplasmic protein
MNKIAQRVGLLALVVMGLALSPLEAARPDIWITTKAKLTLLTTDGVSVTAVKVDTSNGFVTLHGKVKTSAEKAKAETVIRGIEGVKDVKNLLQVVPESRKEAVKIADSAIKDKIEASFKADKSLEDVNVKAVDNGVVILSGHTKTIDAKLRAVEVAWDVPGVRHISVEIEAPED